MGSGEASLQGAPGRSIARRRMLRGLGATACLAPLGSRAVAQTLPAPSEQADWLDFRDRFITTEGRVIDTGNGNVSHSEGQGYGLLFAERFNDRATFLRILAWTQRAMRRPSDHLHAWRVSAGPHGRADDPNNATDGETCIAWALLEAGERWDDPALSAAGTAIAVDILRLLVRNAGNRRVLIPGLRGFEETGRLVLNPSYMVMPALPVFARALPDPAWLELAADTLDLLRTAHFGAWGLVPDWMTVPTAAGPPAIWRNRATRFSFDAARVPLYLTWAGLGQEPAAATAAQFWATNRQVPAWADLTTNALASEPAPVGVVAIARLAIAAQRGGGDFAAMPPVSAAGDYYSAALTLLARLAWRDAGLRTA